MRALVTVSEVIGSGPGVTTPFAVDSEVSGGFDTFCFFFGSGSTVEEILCLERTGTGIVVLVVVRGGSVASARSS